MREIDQDIKTNEFHNIYLLTGTESYLQRQYRDRLLAALLPAQDTMNLSRYDGSAGMLPPVKDILAQADTLPFFSDRRVLLLEHTGLFKKGGEALAEYLPSLPKSSVLIFVETDILKTSRLYKAVKRLGVIETLDMPKEADIERWILLRLKKLGKSMTRDAFHEFITRNGESMELMDRELEKLIAYCWKKDAVSLPDVEAVCSSSLHTRIFDLTDAIAKKDEHRTMQIYLQLLEAQEDPWHILHLLLRQYRQMLSLLELKKDRLSETEMADILHIRSFVVKKNLRFLQSYDEVSLKKLIHAAGDLQYRIMTGRMNETIGVELYIKACLSA